MLTAMQAAGFLVINPRAGDQQPTAGELRDEAERRGIRVHVLERGEDAAEAARSAEAEALGVAGGDGSVAPVAEVAIERDLPLACVPLGTRNHFARDLGLDPADPIAALRAFESRERRIDVGRVDGRVFVNNVSLGLYAGLVHERERHSIHGRVLTSVRAVLRGLRRRRVRLTIDGERSAGRIVLVANNAYQLDLFSLGERERLDEGRLYLYEAEGLLPGRWTDRSGARFEIGSSAARLRAAIDGEPVLLEPPCEFRIEPGALRVLVPPNPG
jgi:diacylglycerol kinase family enzyme